MWLYVGNMLPVTDIAVSSGVTLYRYAYGMARATQLKNLPPHRMAPYTWAEGYEGACEGKGAHAGTNGASRDKRHA